MAASDFAWQPQRDRYKSIWHDDETRYLYNPLVAILGIGTYNSNALRNLDGVETDCANARYVLNYIRGYSIIYMNRANGLVHMQHPERSPQHQFKLRWTRREVTAFNRRVKRKFTTEFGANYDCLIYIISSHGNVDGVINVSSGDEYKLRKIFKFFDNDNCVSLQNKPKIFIVDCCRGGLRTKYQPKDKMVSDETESKDDSSSIDAVREILMKPIIDSIARTMAQLQRQVSDTGDVTSISGINSVASQNRATQASKHTSDRPRFSGRLTSLSDFYTIYGNVDGYAVVEGKEKGGYLLRSLLKVLAKDEYFEKFTLRELVQYARYVKNDLIGEVGAQTFEEARRTNYAIRFKSARLLNARYSIAALKINAAKFTDNAGKKSKQMSIAEAGSKVLSYAANNNIVKINNSNGNVTVEVNDDLMGSIHAILNASVTDEEKSNVVGSVDTSSDGQTVTFKNYRDITGDLVINDKYLPDSSKDAVLCITACHKTNFKVVKDCKKLSVVLGVLSDISVTSACTLEEIEMNGCNWVSVSIDGKVPLVTLTASTNCCLSFDRSAYDAESLPKIVLHRPKGAIQVEIGIETKIINVVGNGSFEFVYNYDKHKWEQ